MDRLTRPRETLQAARDRDDAARSWLAPVATSGAGAAGGSVA